MAGLSAFWAIVSVLMVVVAIRFEARRPATGGQYSEGN